MGQTKIKIDRYKNPANVDGWDGYVEPDDNSWILYFGPGGRTKFYPHRDRMTGAVIEPEAPTQRFIVWRHVDKTGVSGTGLVAYGWEREDGRAVVRWLGEHRTETLHEGGMVSVHAIHGHGGATSILMCDVDPDVIVMCMTAPAIRSTYTSGETDDLVENVYLTRDPDRGWIVGINEPCAEWAVVKVGAEYWGADAVLGPNDAIIHGDKIEGVVSLDGEQRLFRETTGGTLISRTPIGVDNHVESWISDSTNPRVDREFEWHEVVEILAAGFSHVIVTRLDPNCGGDPAYHRIPVTPGAIYG